MHPIITVENLSKKYKISHQSNRPRYKSLRDVVTDGVAGLFRSRGNRQNASPKTEDFWALKDINFEIHQGDVVGIIGRNGAGKSTLLKVLSRITEPTTGCVRLRGRVASLLEVGTGFHPELTGRENIYLNGAILGMTRVEIKSKFDEIVAFAEVEKFLDTAVKHYSSGMYVRLAFSVAAHLEPEILIVDEVLAVGDTAFQKKCLGKMEAVSRGHGRTVLFVSHNIGAVQALCGRGLFLQGGNLKRVGTITSVAGEYMASLSHLSGNGGGARSLGPTLRLGKMEFRPLPAESGGPLRIHMQLLCDAPTVIRQMALLIYSDYGVRVAVLDLRPNGFYDLPVDYPGLSFEVQIQALPLVEGDYRLGSYLVTDEYQGDHLDLASFSIGARRDQKHVTPYPAQNRGFAEVEFTVGK